MSRKLVVSDGTRERELLLVGRLVVGRDPTCDITHDHSLLSRRHAEFVSAGDLVVVRDLGSRNGVFVNGAKTAEHSLHPGDVVQIGPLRAQYIVDAAALSIAPEDHDTDRTAVMHGQGSRPTTAAVPAARTSEPPPPPAAAAPSAVVDNDEEATRLVTARPAAARPSPPPPPAAASVDDDETRFVSRKPSLDLAAAVREPVELPASLDDESTDEGMPQAARASAAPAMLDDAPLSVVRTAAPTVERAIEDKIGTAAPSLRGFLFAQLLLFAGLIIIAFVVALLRAGVPTPLPALLATALVAALAAFVLAGLTDRRITRARSAQDVP